MYWHHLVARVCHVLEYAHTGLGVGTWCDQFVPVDYGTERIEGHAWFGVGPREHEKWQFVLVLAKPVHSRESIVWAELLPPPGSESSWIVIEGRSKRIRIEPSLYGASST